MKHKTQAQILSDEQINTKNKSTRLPILFCIESTKHLYIEDIQDGFNNFLSEISSSDDLSSCTEVAIMQFDSTQRIVRDFSLINSDNEKIFIKKSEDGGFADLGNTLLQAIRKIKIQKLNYDLLGVNYYNPTIVLISSGKYKNDIQKALDTITGLKERGVLAIIPFIYHGDNIKIFEAMSVNGEVYNSYTTGYERLFDQIKKSMHSLSGSSVNAYRSLLDASTDWDDFKFELR